MSIPVQESEFSPRPQAKSTYFEFNFVWTTKSFLRPLPQCLLAVEKESLKTVVYTVKSVAFRLSKISFHMIRTF